jgi:predicted glycoside hydrolase/deacetylase ChbG (UPF0249 family)
MSERLLIVNADDFGRSPGINAGISKAHEHGILTSASLMVRWPAAAEAAAYAREHPSLSLGLHFELGESEHRDGEWVSIYEVRPPHDRVAIEDELARQLDAFRVLADREPTHLDSHQHVHLREPSRSVLAGAADSLGVPLRQLTPWIRYCWEFYGQSKEGESAWEQITVEALVRLVEAVEPGITELSCHPAASEDVESVYRLERLRELEALCDPRVRSALAAAAVELVSFADVAARSVRDPLSFPGLTT